VIAEAFDKMIEMGNEFFYIYAQTDKNDRGLLGDIAAFGGMNNSKVYVFYFFICNSPLLYHEVL
jgi:hypothetical protein